LLKALSKDVRILSVAVCN